MINNLDEKKLQTQWKIMLFLFVLSINVESLIPTQFGHTLGFFMAGIFAYVTFLYYSVNKKKFVLFPCSKQSYLMLVLAMITFISAFFGVNFSNSFSSTTTMIGFLILYIILFNLMKDRTEDSTKYFAKILVIIVSFTAVIALLQIFMGTAHKVVESGFEYFRAKGTNQQINEFSTILVMSLPIAITLIAIETQKKYKFLWMTMTMLISLGMLLTVSRASMITVIIGLVWLLFRMGKKDKKLIILLLGLLLIVIWLTNIDKLYFYRFGPIITNIKDLSKTDVYSRVETYKNAWNIFIQNPLLGIGAANFPEYNRLYNTVTGEYFFIGTHNTYLGILADRGIFALLCFIFIIVISFNDAFKVANFYRKIQNNKMALLFIGYETFVLTYSIRIIFIDEMNLKLFWLVLPLISVAKFTIFKKSLT